MPVTTSSIIPDSGSSRKPHGTSKAANPLRVARGIFGIHCAITTSYARAPDGSARSCQNAASDNPSATVIVAHASSPEALRENARMPTTPLTSAPSPGSRGISQIYFIFFRRLARAAGAHDLMRFISSMLTVSLFR